MNATSSLRRFLWPKSLAGKAGMAALLFGVVLTTTYFAAAHFTQKRLTEAWRQFEQHGLSSDLDALLGPHLAPEKNAAIQLSQAALSASQCEVAARQKQKLESHDDGLENAAYLAEFDSLLRDSNYERMLVEADEHQYRSVGGFVRPLNVALFNPTATVSERRSVGRVETAMAFHLANTRRREEAVRRLLRVLRITRKWENREPFQIFALVNIAVRGNVFEALNLILRRGGPISRELHAELDAELARQEAIRNVLPWVLQTETTFIFDGYFEGLPLKSLPFGNLLADAGRTHLLQTALRIKPTFDLPYPEAARATALLGAEIVDLRQAWLGAYFTFGSDALWTSFNMSRRAFERSVAKTRCLRIVNAMAAKGDFNAELNALGLPSGSLIDPFDEKPLRVKRTDKGPIIYSVGEDLTDDGGKLEYPSPTDVGLGPIIYRPVS